MTSPEKVYGLEPKIFKYVKDLKENPDKPYETRRIFEHIHSTVEQAISLAKDNCESCGREFDIENYEIVEWSVDFNDKDRLSAYRLYNPKIVSGS